MSTFLAKELTNNRELITTTNIFGHSILYTKLQELPSEVAYAKIEATKEKIELPTFCDQETFTILRRQHKSFGESPFW